MFNQNVSLKYLKKWTPITMVNVDNKIISASVAARFHSVIPYIVSEHQAGFIKGRYMGETTRLVYDIIEHNNKTPNKFLAIAHARF